MSLSSAIRTGLYGALQVAGKVDPLVAAATTMTVNSLSLNNDGSYSGEFAIYNSTGSASDISFDLNGNTTAANYYTQYLYGDHTTPFTSRSNNAILRTLPAGASMAVDFTIKKDPQGNTRVNLTINTDAPASIKALETRSAFIVAGDINSFGVRGSVASSIGIGSWIKVYKIGAPQSGLISDWQSGASVITASGGNPTKGTIVTDKVYWRRVGDSMEIRVDYQQSAAGAAGSGQYLWTIPDGKTIDTSKVRVYTGVITAGTVGTGVWTDAASFNRFLAAMLYDTTHFRLLDPTTGFFSSSTVTFATYAGWAFSVTFTVPILEWDTP